jgi:hypothetical protein
MGQVTTLPPGSPATASITQTGANTWTIVLGIPQGEKGEKGDPGEAGGGGNEPDAPVDMSVLTVSGAGSASANGTYYKSAESGTPGSYDYSVQYTSSTGGSIGISVNDPSVSNDILRATLTVSGVPYYQTDDFTGVEGILTASWNPIAAGQAPAPTVTAGGGSSSAPVLRITSDTTATGCSQAYNLTSGDPSRPPVISSNEWIFTGVSAAFGTWTLNIRYIGDGPVIDIIVSRDGTAMYMTSVSKVWVDLADTVASITAWSDYNTSAPVNMTLTIE